MVRLRLGEFPLMENDRLTDLAYRRTEEPTNVYYTRPLADGIVRVFASSRIVTPNSVTVVGMLVGIGSAVFLSIGEQPWLRIGALVLQLSSILDMADGQLARKTGTGSEFGRQLDGASDYIVGISLFLGVLVGLYPDAGGRTPMPVVFILVAAAFAGISLHSLSYDYMKTKFSSIAKTGIDSLEQERRDRSKDSESERRPKRRLKRAAIALYSRYSEIQHALLRLPQYEKVEYGPEERFAVLENERVLLRLFSWIGPTTHLLILSIGALFGDLLAAVVVLALPMNVYYVVVMMHTRRRARSQ